MMLSLTKDNNKIALRKLMNVFEEAEWVIKIVWGLKVKREKEKLVPKRFGNE